MLENPAICSPASLTLQEISLFDVINVVLCAKSEGHKTNIPECILNPKIFIWNS